MDLKPVASDHCISTREEVDDKFYTIENFLEIRPGKFKWEYHVPRLINTSCCR